MAVPTTSQAIQQQIQQLAADLNNQIKIQNTYRATGTAGIGGAYKELGSQLTGLQGQTTKDVSSGRTQLLSDYGRAGSNIQGAEATLREMLGTQGGLEADIASGPLAQIQQLNAERALSQADSLASHNTLGTGYINAARTAVGDAGREGAQQKASLTSQIGAEIGEMQRQYLKEKSAAQVAYAEALAEEKYRAEQMALERQKLAAENAARAQAARDSAAANRMRYQGEEGLMQWAAANGIPKPELEMMKKAIAIANQSGHPEDAYKVITQHAVSQQALQTAMKRGAYDKEPYSPFVKGYKSPTIMNYDRLNTGLNIFYGQYSSYE